MISNLVRLFTIACALSLAGHMSFAQTRAEQSGTQGTASTGQKGSKAKKASSTNKVDINSASKDELKALGLDDATAQNIIEGRPYKTKRDLVTRRILTQEQYDEVKNRLSAHGGEAGDEHRKKGGYHKKGGQGPCPPC